MYPGHVSRRYLSEKSEKLMSELNLIKINDTSADDRVSEDEVERVRYAVKSYCNSILNEFGWDYVE